LAGSFMPVCITSTKAGACQCAISTETSPQGHRYSCSSSGACTYKP
jgi:hypothetical protein